MLDLDRYEGYVSIEKRLQSVNTRCLLIDIDLGFLVSVHRSATEYHAKLSTKID